MKALKGYWVCFGKNGHVDYTTISMSKKGSKAAFLSAFENPTDPEVKTWEYWKRRGWVIKKVNITFELCQ